LHPPRQVIAFHTLAEKSSNVSRSHLAKPLRPRYAIGLYCLIHGAEHHHVTAGIAGNQHLVLGNKRSFSTLDATIGDDA
jgi:hypothetical protein